MTIITSKFSDVVLIADRGYKFHPTSDLFDIFSRTDWADSHASLNDPSLLMWLSREYNRTEYAAAARWSHFDIVSTTFLAS